MIFINVVLIRQPNMIHCGSVAVTFKMKCTKVPGTLAHTYANEHVCIFNYHVRVALEGRVTLAKMAENSLKFWPMLLRILLYKKQRLPRKYLLQLYSNCCYTGQWQNLAISSTTWRWARSVHDVISSHTNISPQILTYYLLDIMCYICWCLHFVAQAFDLVSVHKVFTFSNFLSCLSHLCLQEFVSLVEEQDC